VVENINPLFDPKRVFQQRTFLINDKNRYVSVGFYSTRNYQPLVEFGEARIAPLTLTDQQVTTLAIHLPRLCQEMLQATVIRYKMATSQSELLIRKGLPD
jgi:hypothetical protein